jgi:hypothetical protein
MLQCPSDQALQAFQLGDLPASVLDALADHLEHCPNCEARAQAMDRATDSILSALRTPLFGRSNSPARDRATDASPR